MLNPTPSFIIVGADTVARRAPEADAIVSVGYDLPISSEGFETFYFNDASSMDWRQAFKDVMAFTKRLWDERKTILFHCQKGESRSPTVAFFCMAEYMEVDNLKDASRLVSPSFWEQKLLPAGIESLSNDDLLADMAFKKLGLATGFNIIQQRAYDRSNTPEEERLTIEGDLQDFPMDIPEAWAEPFAAYQARFTKARYGF